MLIISFESKDMEYFLIVSMSPKSCFTAVITKETCGGQGILACDVMGAYVDALYQTKT